MYQRNYSRDDIHLVAKDNVMNAPALENSMLTYQSKQFLMLRPELVQICDCDAIEAFILRIVETKMQQGLDWVTLSYRQIKDMLYRIVSSENTIITKLTNLLKKGFLKRRPNPDHPHASPQYRIDIETTQKAINTIASVFDGGVPIIGTGKDVSEEIPVPEIGTGGYQELVPGVPVDGTGEYQKLVPIIDIDITKKITEEDKEISSTHVDDALPPYEGGLKPRNSILAGWLADMSLLDDAFLAEMEKLLPPAELSTPVIPIVDTKSHIVMPISNAPTKEMATTKPAPQAKMARKKAAVKQDTMAIDITAEGMAVYRDWCSLFKVTVPLNRAIAKAANELVEPIAVWAAVKGCTHKEVLKLIKNWLYEQDKNGYYSRGVKLYDIAREFEGWQSKQEQPQSMNGSGKQKTYREEELVEWQGRMMTEEEANTLGFNGGFGAYL